MPTGEEWSRTLPNKASSSSVPVNVNLQTLSAIKVSIDTLAEYTKNLAGVICVFLSFFLSSRHIICSLKEVLYSLSLISYTRERERKLMMTNK